MGATKAGEIMRSRAGGELPRAGRMLPSFTLPDANSASGSPVRLWDFKQRQPLLIALLHPARCAVCSAWLRQLAAKQARLGLAEARVAVLLILPESSARLRTLQRTLDIPYPLLADESGAVADTYLPADNAGDVGGVALYAADRYGQCLAAWSARDADGFPALAAPLAEFAFAEQDDCACTIPAWGEE